LKDDKPLKFSLDIGEDQADPAEFRECVILAEELGFDHAWLGDHFMPWVHSGNRSAFVWSLLGTALESTRRIKVGPYVTAPIGARYHPAILAQAGATLDSLYPGRFLMGVGTGEAVNEAHFVDYAWPPWKERMERLIEGIALMKRFWRSSSYFDFEGKYFRMKQVYLYTKPRTDLEIYFSAIGPKAARFAGEFGDHLITTSSRNPLERCRDVIFPSFEAGAKAAGKAPETMGKIVTLSFTLEDKQSYLASSRKYAGVFAGTAQHQFRSYNEPDPRRIEKMGSDEEILQSTTFCSTWSDVIELISKYREIGVTEIVLDSGADKAKIREMALKILSQFRDQAAINK
jgi:coenzyme F420-dependent glucose-6-phosphate dehydrogenase